MNQLANILPPPENHGTDGGISHSVLLSIWALSIDPGSREHKPSETGTVSVLGIMGGGRGSTERAKDQFFLMDSDE